jgi:beta-N-acetylhexosaminidase
MISNRTHEDLKTALGQCFWIGIDGTSADVPSTMEIFKTFKPGGIVLFLRNVESIDQVRKLNADLQQMAEIPLFIAIDQEGGTVERLQALIGTIPPAMSFSAARNKRLIRKVHGTHSRILNQLGFNVNFTPVLDLALTFADNGLGTRCFSDRPKEIAKYAKEVINAHEKHGILVCGKHFPGLGDTDRDSHFDLPTVPRPWKQIQREDLYPYKKLLASLPFIMINHALYKDKNRKLPASLAPEIVRDFLIKQWKYAGLSISDDLIMGAVSNMYNLTESASRALLAGNHLFLVCKPDGVVASFKRLLSRAKSDETLRNHIFHSCARILSFKFGMPSRERPINVQKEIQSLHKYSSKVSEESITWIRGKPQAKPTESCSIYLPQTKWLKEDRSAIGEYLRAQKCRVQEYFFPIDIPVDDARRLAKRSASTVNIIVCVNNRRHEGQRALLQELASKNRRTIVIGGGYPLDWIPEGTAAAVAAYWTSHSALLAATRVVFGKQKARGKMPLLGSVT